MKEVAITIKPHWAYAIFHLGKDIENRTWALPEKYEGQRVWIHSGAKATTKESADFYDYLKEIGVFPQLLSKFSRPSGFPHGAIVGSVELEKGANSATWAMPDHYWWHIKNKILLPEPIPAKGKLSFWDCTKLVQHLI